MYDCQINVNVNLRVCKYKYTMPEFIPHLSVLGVDNVELRQLELSLVSHSHGGVVPAVAHLGHWVGDYKTNK